MWWYCIPSNLNSKCIQLLQIDNCNTIKHCNLIPSKRSSTYGQVNILTFVFDYWWHCIHDLKNLFTRLKYEVELFSRPQFQIDILNFKCILLLKVFRESFSIIMISIQHENIAFNRWETLHCLVLLCSLLHTILIMKTMKTTIEKIATHYKEKEKPRLICISWEILIGYYQQWIIRFL